MWLCRHEWTAVGAPSKHVTAPGARMGQSVMRSPRDVTQGGARGAEGATAPQPPPPCSFKSWKKWVQRLHLGDGNTEALRG